MTDARHGWRKNAKDSSVVAIDERTHKVLTCEHVKKSDDPVSQRHEKVGTERIYTMLAGNDVHTHDRNASINKFIREKEDTINRNDTWHAVKSLKTAMKKVSSGPKYLQDKTWCDQLDDKVESVATHFHWAMRNCNEDPRQLKTSLLNIVDHYKTNMTVAVNHHGANKMQNMNLKEWY